MTQILMLPRLGPEIQEHLLALPLTVERPVVSERLLRPMLQIEDPDEQMAVFREHFAQA